MQGRRQLRLYGDDARRPAIPRGNAADQSAAADRDQERVDVGRVLFQFQPDRALAKQGLLLVKGVNRHGAGLRDMDLACRQRIGRALANRCTELAQSECLPTISLWSRPYQRAGHILYESLGYQRQPARAAHTRSSTIPSTPASRSSRRRSSTSRCE